MGQGGYCEARPPLPSITPVRNTYLCFELLSLEPRRWPLLWLRERLRWRLCRSRERERDFRRSREADLERLRLRSRDRDLEGTHTVSVPQICTPEIPLRLCWVINTQSINTVQPLQHSGLITHTVGSCFLLGFVLPPKCQWVIQFAGKLLEKAPTIIVSTWQGPEQSLQPCVTHKWGPCK